MNMLIMSDKLSDVHVMEIHQQPRTLFFPKTVFLLHEKIELLTVDVDVQ